jgi:hypothetical protein
VFADETTLPTTAPGSEKVRTAYLRTYARDDRPFAGTAPPMVVYRFEDFRSGDCVAGTWMVMAAFCRWTTTQPIHRFLDPALYKGKAGTGDHLYEWPRRGRHADPEAAGAARAGRGRVVVPLTPCGPGCGLNSEKAARYSCGAN